MYKSQCITDLCKLSHVFLEGSAPKNPPQSFRELLYFLKLLWAFREDVGFGKGS